MKVHNEEIQQRVGFIDRTIFQAMRACCSDSRVPEELKGYVQQLGLQSSRVQKALQSHDEHNFRQSVSELERTSFHAQNAIHAADDMNYTVKSAVILAHLELSALRYQLD